MNFAGLRVRRWQIVLREIAGFEGPRSTGGALGYAKAPAAHAAARAACLRKRAFSAMPVRVKMTLAFGHEGGKTEDVRGQLVRSNRWPVAR